MQSSLRSRDADERGNDCKRRLHESDSYVCFLLPQMSSSAWQTAAVKEECKTVLGVISRPGDNQDRSMCSLRLLKPPVQKAREKCTQIAADPLFCQHCTCQSTANTVPADLT